MRSERRRRGPRIRGGLAAFVIIVLCAPVAHAAEITGITYREAGTVTLKLDAFIPDGPGPHPGVVLLHGGGWTRGSRNEMAGLGRWLADRGLAAFAIDYRLAPAYRYPAAVEDAQAAVRWVRSHARSYDVDPARLAAFGLSAGGYLAAMVGVLGEGSLDRDARVRVAVAWSAPLDLARLPAESRSTATRSMIEAFAGCSDCVARLREASPAAHVDSTDAALFLVNSTSEAQPIAQAGRLERGLLRAGVPASLIRVRGSRHAGAYGGTVAEATGETVLEASTRYMGIWFDQPRLSAGPAASGPAAPAPAAEPIAPELLVVAALVLIIVAAFRAGGRRSRRGWFDPAAMALLDTLGAAGASAGEIEATLRQRAPRPTP